MPDSKDSYWSDAKEVLASYVPILGTYNELAAKSEGLSKAYGLQGREVDAFRHTYSSAMLTRKYGVDIAETLGTGYELASNLQRISKQGYGYTAADAFQDFHNNKMGRKIEQLAKSEAEIIQEVLSKIKTGEVISNQEVAWKKYKESEQELVHSNDPLTRILGSKILTKMGADLRSEDEILSDPAVPPPWLKKPRDDTPNPPQSGGFFNAIGDFFGGIGDAIGGWFSSKESTKNFAPGSQERHRMETGE